MSSNVANIASTDMTRLTLGMRDVLELGARGYTSKEIGRFLGISPYTVDQRFVRACKVLSVTSRKEAIRRYTALGISKPIVYDASELTSGAIAAEAFPQFTLPERESAAVEPDEYVRLTDRSSGSSRAWLPFPTREARRNDLTLTQKLFWLVAIWLFSIVGLRVILETLRDLGDILPAG